MLILGISDSHEAHACVLEDGQLKSAVAEERLSGLKSDMGYPSRSIQAALDTAGVAAKDIDIVAFAGTAGAALHKIYKPNALFSVQDWIRQCHDYWKPILLEGKTVSPFQDFDAFKHLRNGELEADPYYPFIEKARDLPASEQPAIFNRIRAEAIENQLGIPTDKVRFFRHEDCHKAYGFFSSPHNRETALVFTIEGGGDDSSATISIVEPNGDTRELWRSNSVQVGRLYRYVTLILGMKPSQHEYKVMGLAPYGTEYHGRASLEFFRTINVVDGTEIRDLRNVPDLYFSVRDALEGERFDGIAWGIQTWLEELLCEWVRNNVIEHRIDNVILSGGVAQNIKANKSLGELPEIRQFWAGPIAGDGSLGIGAAWLAAKDHNSAASIVGLPTVYLGTSATSEAVEAAVAAKSNENEYTIIRNPDADLVAGWLESGLVVARYSGQMEFGQRALGNRSILADPRDAKSVERINSKIKYRDFWMPFTPSMMIEEADRILLNPDNLYSPFMTIAFDLKPEFVDLIPAAIHPADKTARPQMLREEDNPGYYAILKAFKLRTGIGVLLNTSFNLHGEPIVESPADAISTLERSDIDALIFDDVAIARSDRLPLRQ